MNHNFSVNRSRKRRHLGPCVALLASAAGASAQTTFEFVDHNGFEACWSGSKDATTMAQLIVDSIEGIAGCIPAQPDGTIPHCYSTTCSGGQPGCPTVLHGSSSQHVGGTTDFNTTATLESVSGKIIFPIYGECDFTINTTNVTLNFPLTYAALPEYGLVADGNNGYYMTAVTVGSMNVAGLKSSDVSVSGGVTCFTAVYNTTVYSNILAEVKPSIEAAVEPTLDHPWCPYPF